MYNIYILKVRIEMYPRMSDSIVAKCPENFLMH